MTIMRAFPTTVVCAFLATLSCGQPAPQDAPGVAASGSAGAAVALAPAGSVGPAGSAGSAGHGDESDDDAVPTDKFSDGARAFDTVRASLLRSYHAEGITEDDLYRAATAGMLEKLEPKMKKWNKLLSAKEVAELRNDLKGEVVGIGVHIAFDSPSGYADVLAAFPGSPAEKAGLAAGDKIVTVNGKLYKGMKMRDVVADIRGKAGEPVTVTVLRADKLVTFTVVRERVVYDQPSHALLADGLGYLCVPSFNEKTPGQVREALDDLAKKNAQALVVDLRQNPGGSFERAVETAELLLPQGAGIVSLKRRGKEEEKHVAKTKGLLTNVPLAVIVSRSTGSGAEFVTGALREGRRARVVGQRTMGKWSVQSLDDLPNGYAYKYTVSLFRTPSGKTYEGVGLSPDVEVAMDDKDLARAKAVTSADDRLAIDVQLRTAKEIVLRRP